MSVLLERRDGVGVVTIDLPERRNSLTVAMSGQLSEHVAACEADPNHDTDSPGYQKWGHYYNMINESYGKIGCGTRSAVPTG